MPRRPLTDAPEVEVADAADLRAWLGANGATSPGVWLVHGKKAAGDRYLPTEEIVAECLAHGWVDSLVRAKDTTRTMLYIAPRRAGSNWSRVNRDLVARLEAEGRMAPAGRAAVDRTKADGTWTALDGVEALDVPADLAAALGDLRPVWDAWPRSVRRGALETLLNARRPATRAAKIAAIRDAAIAGERPFQWRGAANR